MEAKIFLTDYASYNNGTQFEFGHWVDLSQFSDVEEFNAYVSKHFVDADKKSPLGDGSTREEMMITDFEGFPRSLYSECGMNFEQLFEYINLDNHEVMAVAFLLEQGNDFQYAMDHKENVNMTENTGRDAHYELFEMYYPDAAKADENCHYLEVDYDRFIDENFTEFEYEGTTYLIAVDSWD
ncbi:MAG: antirestriction protein ArdA [Chryseolinea sp.]